MGLIHYIKSKFNREETEVKTSTATTSIDTGITREVEEKRDNRTYDNLYKFSDEDHAKAREMRRLKAEVRRQELIRKAYMDKIRDDVEMKKLRNEMEELDGDTEDDVVNQIFKQTLSQIMTKNNIPMNTPQANSFESFEKEIKTNTMIGPEIKETVEDENEEQEFKSRFTDEQLKANIPKLLNPQQIELIKGLTEDEIYQMYDVIKKDL